jgi:hypothetical protein
MRITGQNSRRESFDESVCSPMSKQSQFHKSVRSGGGLFSKGINNLNATTSNFNPDKMEEFKHLGLNSPEN